MRRVGVEELDKRFRNLSRKVIPFVCSIEEFHQCSDCGVEAQLLRIGSDALDRGVKCSHLFFVSRGFSERNICVASEEAPNPIQKSEHSFHTIRIPRLYLRM